MITRRAALALPVLAPLAAPSLGRAQAWRPSQPIRIIIPAG